MENELEVVNIRLVREPSLYSEQILDSPQAVVELMAKELSQYDREVKGIDDVAVRFSRCCNPVPGDEIVGFVTRGRGLSIHRTDCVNMIHLTEAERARLIPAEWEGNVAEETGGQYLAEIKMYARDQQGLLMSISKVFTEMEMDVKSLNIRTSKQGTATIEAGFIVHGREELAKVIGKLRQIDDVIDIERTTG